MNGWHGKILRINLTDGNITEEKLPDEYIKFYLGGRGIGVKILYDELPPYTPPLDPQNKLIFATGPLTSTTAETSGRYCVVTKSPLTNTVFDANSGGRFGVELKNSGYDIVIVEGKASKPSYILIGDNSAEIRSAEGIWGLDTHKTTDKLIEKTSGNARVACIGPAGEKLVLISSIINDKHRALGRGGVGAVMGSKNLKAIVASGTIKPNISDEEAFKKEKSRWNTIIHSNPVTDKGLPVFGTAVLVNIINKHGAFPTLNFQEGYFEDAEAISGEKIAELLLTKNTACAYCSIGCGRLTEINLKNGKGKKTGEGPEYESINMLGAMCGINDLEAITAANYICNELGIDTISAGSTIACAMELSQKGYIDEKIEFGDSKAMLSLINDIGNRKGLGEQLSEGSYRFAESAGHPELSMSVKKLEMPAYDPRGIQGMGLSYATSNRGGCHLRGYMISPEIMGLPCLVDRFKTEGKAELLILMQNVSAIIDSMIVCKFVSFALSVEHYAKLLHSATGIEYSGNDLIAIGDRIWNLERLFNNREGLTGRDDTLPPRLLTEELESGHSKGRVVELDKMLKEYYSLRGWSKDGKPDSDTLKRLGIN